MISLSQAEFAKISYELSALHRRDVTQGVKLGTYRKTANAMLKKDPATANTLLGLLACLEHNVPAMHAYHKKAIELSESCFTLMFYAASLNKSCLWNDAAKYALLALDREPENVKLVDALIQIAPLTGRFSLYRRMLTQRRQLAPSATAPSPGDCEAISGILARHGLLEKDLKEVILAIGDALAETDVILARFRYDLVTDQPESSFIHYRFVIPDQFVASYYEDLIAEKLDSVACHPRVFDAFSYSVENSTVYELYEYMEQELAESADTIRVPDPERMKLIEELVQGVEV